MSQKCPQCGLVNWEYEEFCKRCNTSLNPTDSEDTAASPPVYKWFLVYCIFMALLYFGMVLMGIMIMFLEPDSEANASEPIMFGAAILILGLVFCHAYAAAPFLPRKNWAWVFGRVLICIGLTSACFLPVCIPLLIFWLKPEVKAFYGKTLSPLSPPPPPQWS